VSEYAYKPRTIEQTTNECRSGLYNLLNNMENLTSRGLRSLLSSHQFKNVQDKYQLPTAFGSTEAHTNWDAAEIPTLNRAIHHHANEDTTVIHIVLIWSTAYSY
jgi:hypothetical protein